VTQALFFWFERPRFCCSVVSSDWSPESNDNGTNTLNFGSKNASLHSPFLKSNRNISPSTTTWTLANQCFMIHNLRSAEDDSSFLYPHSTKEIQLYQLHPPSHQPTTTEPTTRPTEQDDLEEERPQARGLFSAPVRVNQSGRPYQLGKQDNILRTVIGQDLLSDPSQPNTVIAARHHCSHSEVRKVRNLILHNPPESLFQEREVRKKFLPRHHEVLQEMMDEFKRDNSYPSTMEEWWRAFHQRLAPEVPSFCQTTFEKTLRKTYGFSLHKTQRHHPVTRSKSNQEEQANWIRFRSQFTSRDVVEHFLFADEAHFGRSQLGRSYQWAPRGATPVVLGWRKDECASVTVQAVLCPRFKTGPILYDFVHGSSDGLHWHRFFTQQVLPVLHSGDYFLMDGASIHKSEGFIEEIKSAAASRSAHIHTLPPYHPENNPVELLWREVKAKMKQLSINTPLEMAVAALMAQVTQEQVLGFYRECGLIRMNEL
jgi:transposase